MKYRIKISLLTIWLVFTLAIIFTSLYLIVILLLHKNEGEVNNVPEVIEEKVDTVPTFLSQSPQEGLWDALIYYGIHHPEIVHAQAIQESGLGKSKLYLRTNNLFGLYNSSRGEYYKFNHWSESVLAYKNYIQRRHKPPNDYYQFLKDIGYAEDQKYTHKLKQIVRNEQRKSYRRDTISPK